MSLAQEIHESVKAKLMSFNELGGTGGLGGKLIDTTGPGAAIGGALIAGAGAIAANNKYKDKYGFIGSPTPPKANSNGNGEKKNLPPIVPITDAGTGEIPDLTDQNLSQNIGETIDQGKNEYDENKNVIDQTIEEVLQKQWAREDEIRKETQEREDTAYQRAIADMKKAGINPNLVGISPAESGGGIMQTAQPNYTPAEMELDEYLKELEIYLDSELKVEEGQKDRISSMLQKILSTIAMMYLMRR